MRNSHTSFLLSLVAAMATGNIACTSATDEGADELGEAEEALTPAFPALREDVPDPFILRDGNTYHLYATNGSIPFGFANIVHSSSTDLRTWTTRNDALPRVGPWAAPYFTNWAPTVMKLSNGQFIMYYTSQRAGTQQQCIGVAYGNTPAGPFTDPWPRPLICPEGGKWAIDPSTFIAPNGKAYLYWRNDLPPNAVNAVYAQEISRATGALMGSAHSLIQRDRAWEGPILENPAMVALGGKYFLFYSANRWETDRYATGYAECSGPLGPCTKRTTAGPWLASYILISGPGGADFFSDTAGNKWMSYHTWVGGIGYPQGKRGLAVTRVGLSAAGQPRLL